MDTLSRLRGTRLSTLGVPTLLVAALALAGCGEDTEEAPAPGASSAPSASPTPSDGPVDFDEVGEFANPRMSPAEPGTAAPLTERADVTAWLEPYDAPPRLVNHVADAVRTELRTASDGEAVYGVLLGTGCERPTDYTLTRTDGEIEVSVAPVKGTVQCLAPMTFLTVVTVDENA